MTTSSEVFTLVPLIFIGLAMLVSLRAFTANGSQSLRIFSGICILTFAVELFGYYLRYLDPEDDLYEMFYYEDPSSEGIVANYWVYNLYNYFYYLLVAVTFSLQLNSDNVKAAIQFFYVVLTLLFITNTAFFQGLTSYQTLTVVAGGGFVMFLSGAYFWELFISTENEKITRDPFFWFSSGLIVYFGGTIPFLGMLNYLANKFFDFTVLYHMYFSSVFSIFLNTLIIIGFLCRKNFQKSF